MVSGTPASMSDQRRDSPIASNGASSSPRFTPSPDDGYEDEDELTLVESKRTGQSHLLKTLSAGAGRGAGEDDLAKRAPSRDAEDGDEEEKHFLSHDQSASGLEPYTADEDRAVLRKLDRRLVLFMALLYMLSFLDRSNIGNARIAGLSRDLQLSSSQYQWLLTAFYITYILFEWMTLLYRLVPPHVYISLCVLSWGLLASLQSISTSFTTLLIIRALLGVGEAAFGPGVPFYLSFFFRRDELAFRTGLFISAAPLATSFASTLAWAITKLGQGGPVAPWRLLFLVEGFPSIIVAVYAWSFVPDGPGTARWLTPRQRKVAVLRLRKEKSGLEDASPESSGAGSRPKSGLRLREIFQTLADPKCYVTACMFFSCNVAFSSMPVFLPTIINEMGYTSLTSQALSAPPYLFSFAIVLLTAYASDRLQSRSIPILLHSLFAASGYAVIALAGALDGPTWLRYLSIYPACAGFFSAITLVITWTVNNQDSDSKRGTGVAMLNIIGQCGPLLGTRLYPDQDAPFYVRGMAVCAGFMLLVGVLAAALRVVLARENERRRRKAQQNGDAGVPLVAGGAWKENEGPFLFML